MLESKDTGAALHTLPQTSLPRCCGFMVSSPVWCAGNWLPGEYTGRWGLMRVRAACVPVGQENAALVSKSVSQWSGLWEADCLFPSQCHMKRSGVPLLIMQNPGYHFGNRDSYLLDLKYTTSWTLDFPLSRSWRKWMSSLYKLHFCGSLLEQFKRNCDSSYQDSFTGPL